MKRKTMRPAPLFLICAAAAALIVTAGLLAAGVFPLRTGPPGPSQPVYAGSDDQTVMNAAKDQPVDAEFAAPTPPAEGPLLVKEKCGGCHQARVLQKHRLSPQRWEAMFKRMERYDVELSDAERQTLIEYLTATN